MFNSSCLNGKHQDDMIGVIRYRERKQQILDFSEMRFFNKITPTDIDGSIDFKGALFVFIEIKLGNAPLPYGQKSHLEALVLSKRKANIPCFAFICSHDVQDTEKDINAAYTRVEKYIYSLKINPKSIRWLTPKHDGAVFLKDCIDKAITYTMQQHPGIDLGMNSADKKLYTANPNR
tara:strand:+ start:565 stop:1095 length:531 start_codon:yes stop_codon:yes gene_type:complete